MIFYKTEVRSDAVCKPTPSKSHKLARTNGEDNIKLIMPCYTSSITLLFFLLPAFLGFVPVSAQGKLRGSNHDISPFSTKDDKIFFSPFQQKLLQHDLNALMKDMGPIPTGRDLSMESTHAKYVTHLRHSNNEGRGEGKDQEPVGRDLSLHKRIVNGWKATEETKYFCMTMVKEDDGTYYRGTQNEGMYSIIER